ncbi:MAG: hypothetical protein Q8O76_00675 [Chloroflexota bacterium]|nr:hypothetical protein [Chloroflexota bacterium]
MEEIKERAKRITDLIYHAYGSGTGYLFGIDPQWRSSVEAIVKITIELVERQKEE